MKKIVIAAFTLLITPQIFAQDFEAKYEYL